METGNSVNPNLISIIVPIYNGEAYIDRCVESILAQTCPEWELLLLDGASSDNSLRLCDLWGKKDSRIRVFHSEENRGVSESRNKGIANAAGAYIMFVDIDDWLMPDCLQRLYEDIQAPGVGIAGCGFRRCTDEDWERQKSEGRSDISEKNPEKRLISGKDFLKEGILKQDTRCWSKLYKKELIDGHFFREDYSIGEDMLFVWEVTRKAELISVSGYEGYAYYHNVNGTMLKRFRASDIDQIRCWKFLLERLQSETESGLNEKNDTSVTFDAEAVSKTASILMISCMLVVGKLAALSAAERKHYTDIKKQCSDVLKETLCIEGAYERLDGSYKVKVRMYRRFPELYILLYHFLKQIGRNHI